MFYCHLLQNFAKILHFLEINKLHFLKVMCCTEFVALFKNLFIHNSGKCYILHQSELSHVFHPLYLTCEGRWVKRRLNSEHYNVVW